MKWSIQYDSTTKMYAISFEGEVIAYAWTLVQAEQTIEALNA